MKISMFTAQIELGHIEMGMKGGEGLSCRRNIMNQDRKGESICVKLFGWNIRNT